MSPASVKRRALLGLALALTSSALGGCIAVTPTPGQVTIDFNDRQTVIAGATCTWSEDSGQLFVEAGDEAGAAYLLLAAPLQWIGEELPEGPGADPELSLRLGGTELAVDESSLEGAMNPAQTDGTFLGRLADGSPISGEWSCTEVLEGTSGYTLEAQVQLTR